MGFAIFLTVVECQRTK